MTKFSILRPQKCSLHFWLPAVDMNTNYLTFRLLMKIYLHISTLNMV